MPRASDARQLELLSWEPPEIVARLPAALVRADSLRARLARAVAASLRDAPQPREAIAARMAAWLGEPVPLASLNAYASQGRPDHTISALRLAALAEATGDLRPLQELLAPLQAAAVDQALVPAIEAQLLRSKGREMIRAAGQREREMRAAAERLQRQLARQWRPAGRRSTRQGEAA